MWLSMSVVAGCARSTSPLPAVNDDHATAATPSAATIASPVQAHEATLDAAAPRDAALATPIPTAACSSDDECGWDDPCSPAACGAKQEVPKGKNCGRPATPGACRCVEKTCTLVKSEALRSTEKVQCKQSSDCAFDPNQGSCVSATESTTPARGIGCQCDTLNSWCTQIWRGEVACKTAKDCSWQHLNGEGTNAAPAWFVPRPKPAPVRPCKDGEHDSVCKEGKCSIVAWKC
jgi:hypothetical protein